MAPAVLRRMIHMYTRAVTNYPLAFISGPLIFMLAFAPALRLNKQLFSFDMESLFTPANGPYRTERALSQQLWPLDPDNFLLGHGVYNLKQTAQVIFRSTTNENFFNHTTLSRLKTWNDDIVKSLTVRDHRGKQWSYRDICLRYGTRQMCSFENQHLSVIVRSLEPKGTSRHSVSVNALTFPRWRIVPGTHPDYMGAFLGAVTTEHKGTEVGPKTINSNIVTDEISLPVTSFKAVYLIYPLRADTLELIAAKELWEKAFAANVSSTFGTCCGEIRSPGQFFCDIDASYFFSKSLYYGLKSMSTNILRQLTSTIALLSTFTLGICCKLSLIYAPATAFNSGATNGILKPPLVEHEGSNQRRLTFDWVLSKPILGVCGLMTAVLASAASLALWYTFDGVHVDMVLMMPFLILAIGLDDMFILMAAWNLTPSQWSPAKRTQESIRVSIGPITVTSLTSFLSFLIGSVSDLESVRILCMVIAIAVALNFGFQLSFYVAAMHYSGIIEAEGLVNTVLYFVTFRATKGDSFDKMMVGRTSTFSSSSRFTVTFSDAATTTCFNCKSIKRRLYNSPKAYPHAPHPVHGHSSDEPKATSTLNNIPHLNHPLDSMANDSQYNQINNFPFRGKTIPHSSCNQIPPPKKGKMQQSNRQYCSFGKSSDRRVDPLVYFIKNFYSKWLFLNPVRLFIGMSYVAYLVFALLGIGAYVTEGLEIYRLAAPGHHASKFYKTLHRYFYSEGQQIEIVVSKAPNLTLSIERQRLYDVVHRLESSRYSMGPKGTDFFLRDYEGFLQKNPRNHQSNSPQIWQYQLLRWSTLNSYKRKVLQDLHWTRLPPNSTLACPKCRFRLTAFRFRIGVRNFETSASQRLIGAYFRQACSEYPEYGMSSFHPEWPFIDQYELITPATLTSIALAIGSMALVALVFFRAKYSVFWTVYSIISIDVGVIGFMALWGVHLDSVSMVVIIMSIGLSVDYTAHIVHGFHVARKSKGSSTPTAQDRIRSSLTSLGLPVLQGAMSTVLGVAPLAAIDDYIAEVFFKITFLAIVFGMYHACAVLPIALSLNEVVSFKKVIDSSLR